MKRDPRRDFNNSYLLEEIAEEPSFLCKKMFGGLASYLHGRLMLLMTESEDPKWDGLLIPTSKEHHASICKEYPDLKPHSILGKWLFLTSNVENFEEIATEVIEQIKSDDLRFGVLPSEKKKPRKAKAKLNTNSKRKPGIQRRQ
jgi:hypothetical protein